MKTDFTTHFLFMMSLKLVETTEAGLRFDQISKKLHYPRFTDRKKHDLFFKKSVCLGQRQFHRIFQRNLSSICHVNSNSYFMPH